MRLGEFLDIAAGLCLGGGLYWSREANFQSATIFFGFGMIFLIVNKFRIIRQVGRRLDEATKDHRKAESNHEYFTTQSRLEVLKSIWRIL